MPGHHKKRRHSSSPRRDDSSLHQILKKLRNLEERLDRSDRHFVSTSRSSRDSSSRLSSSPSRGRRHKSSSRSSRPQTVSPRDSPRETQSNLELLSYTPSPPESPVGLVLPVQPADVSPLSVEVIPPTMSADDPLIVSDKGSPEHDR